MSLKGWCETPFAVKFIPFRTLMSHSRRLFKAQQASQVARAYGPKSASLYQILHICMLAS